LTQFRTKEGVAVKKIVLYLNLFIISISAISLLGITERARSEELAQANGNTSRVFIARQRSDFKDALLKNITEQLDAQSVSYEVADISALKKMNDAGYEAVVIIQYVKAGRINSNVRRYLDRTEHMDGVVLVTTSGSGNAKTDKWNIDTISSASEMSELDKITRTVLSRLEALLNVRFAT
jgi:hypothetical protein